MLTDKTMEAITEALAELEAAGADAIGTDRLKIVKRKPDAGERACYIITIYKEKQKI